MCYNVTHSGVWDPQYVAVTKGSPIVARRGRRWATSNMDKFIMLKIGWNLIFMPFQHCCNRPAFKSNEWMKGGGEPQQSITATWMRNEETPVSVNVVNIQHKDGYWQGHSNYIELEGKKKVSLLCSSYIFCTCKKKRHKWSQTGLVTESAYQL